MVMNTYLIVHKAFPTRWKHLQYWKSRQLLGPSENMDSGGELKTNSLLSQHTP